MGLCKCPKRRVTNLFCFVHRVNVCEDCTITQHPRCVIQSYVKWLQDSDYDTICVLCSQSIQTGEVVRLTCYDLLHVACLDSYITSLPEHVEHTDFRCPRCKDALLPLPNMVSPLANNLRRTLWRFEWAQKAIGSIEQLEEEEMEDESEARSEELDFPDIGSPSISTSTPLMNHHVPHHTSHSSSSMAMAPDDVVLPPSSIPQGPSSLQAYHPIARGGASHGHPMVDTRTTGVDSDENKYQRKSFLEYARRWFRNQQMGNWAMDDSSILMRRYIVLAVLAVFSFVGVIILMTRVGRNVAHSDPSLDWKFNPNIKTRD